jgi:hypothetical protein
MIAHLYFPQLSFFVAHDVRRLNHIPSIISKRISLVRCDSGHIDFRQLRTKCLHRATRNTVNDNAQVRIETASCNGAARNGIP